MYVKIDNGAVTQFPYTVGQLRKDNANTSFPKKVSNELLAGYGVYPVTVADQPSFDERTQTIDRKDAPELANGEWTLGWTVADKSAEDIAKYDESAANGVRNKRNNLLAATDYLALSDNTLSAEMATYRQALRDITSHANFPYLEEADWPVKP